METKRRNRNEYFREYRKKNLARKIEIYRKYRASPKGKALEARLRVSSIRQKIIDKYGGVCVRCGFSDIRALQVDHIKGGGKKHIKSFTNNPRTYYKFVLRDETGMFQLLCANCNWIKRYENKECKHDRIG